MKRSGWTVIELLIAVALSLAIAAMTLWAVREVTKMVDRLFGVTKRAADAPLPVLRKK